MVREIHSNDWIVYFLVILLAMLAWVKKRYPRRTQRLIKSFFAASFVKKLKKEEYFISHISTIVLSLTFVAVTSLFLWDYGVSNPKKIGWIIKFFPFKRITFVSVFSFVAFFFVLKVFILKLMETLLRGNEFLDEYLGNYLVISFFIGLLLILPVIGFLFSTVGLKIYFFWTIWAILGFFVVYLIVRGIFVAINHKVSIFYIILYFCTLEILPVLLLVKSISI